MIKQLIILLFGFLFPVIIIAQGTLNPKFEQKIETLIQHTIPTISCKELKEKLTNTKVCILDAREKVEYKVSHLLHAKYVGYNNFDNSALKNIAKETTIVVYCSVGYRSEKIGEKLKKMGYSKVYNLYGGIFEWTNQRYPLVDNQNQTTTKVHAYDKDWGFWLDRGNKVY